MLIMIIVSLVVMVLDGERGGRWISVNYYHKEGRERTVAAVAKNLSKVHLNRNAFKSCEAAFRCRIGGGGFPTPEQVPLSLFLFL